MEKKRILIVVEDPEARRALAPRLRANGFVTAFAPDALAATGAARRCEPDLLLLDLGLPGADGPRVIERLRTLPVFARLPIILLGGRQPGVGNDPVRPAGAELYLQKPVDNDVLLAAIWRALDHAA